MSNKFFNINLTDTVVSEKAVKPIYLEMWKKDKVSSIGRRRKQMICQGFFFNSKEHHVPNPEVTLDKTHVPHGS